MSEFSKYTFSLRAGEASLTLRADKLPELEAMAHEAEVNVLFGPFFGPREGKYTVVHRDAEEPNAVTDMVANVDKLAAEQKAEAQTGLKGDEAVAAAQAAVTKHLGAGEELASDTQIAAASKKSGKTAEELAGISVSEAKRLIKEGSK